MEKDIIAFDLAKINRGKTKICGCKNPHYEIDTTNRLVMCEDCGAIVDAFDALLKLCEHMKEIQHKEERMIEKAYTYSKLADEEIRRMIKNKIFREMNNNYQKGLFPKCIIQIDSWSYISLPNERYAD